MSAPYTGLDDDPDGPDWYADEYGDGDTSRQREVVAPMPSASTLPGVPLSDEQARDLSRAAANVRTWTEKRNALIRAAHAAGGGIREIARATGLNVATVHTMIHGRKR